MIDARNYKTTDELKRAMDNEYYVTKSEFLKREISRLEFEKNTLIQEYDVAIEMLKHARSELLDKINDYHISIDKE